MHPQKARQTFYINIPGKTQGEFLTKSAKTGLLSLKKSKVQKIVNLKAKP